MGVTRPEALALKRPSGTLREPLARMGRLSGRGLLVRERCGEMKEN
jgi:hypothetical protein